MTQNKRKILQAVIAVALILVGIVGVKKMLATRQEPEKAKPPVLVPLARTVKIAVGQQQVILVSQGTVKPVNEIQLVPQVSGKVVRISPKVVNGGAFSKGDLLLSIDPSDYEIALTLAKARVKAAESQYELSKQEAEAARYEWDKLQPGSKPPPLAVREPQLDAARASLDAEKANLKKARLLLERTRLLAPFNGRVSNENVDEGQFVSPGQPLATLYSTDAAKIILPMEDRDLFWFHIPGFTQGVTKEPEVEVHGQLAGINRVWPGKVVRTEGRLNERTRMVNVVVRVEDPYAQRPPLVAGLFVTVHIKGRVVENAAFIPRASLREGEIVWVVDESGKLEFRKVDVARFSTKGVMIRGGLSEGEQVVISQIKAVSDGMQVRNIPTERGNKS